MSLNKVWMRRLFLGSVPILLGIAFAQATPDEVPCGLVTKTGKGVQLIPHQGSVQNHFSEGAPISCESMIITHQEAFWVKFSDQTVVKIAPLSFIELPKQGSGLFRIYRGQVLVSAPPGIETQTWSTPNSESIFKGGVAFFHYQADRRVTTVSSFNKEFQFRNKFNPDAQATVRAGEMSHLAIQEANVNPSQPVVMNQASVNVTLSGLKLSDSDQNELLAIVKRVYQDRSKSMISEIEDWESLPPDSTRGPAESLAQSTPSKSALDPKETDFVNQMMRERVYGEDPGRKPASTRPRDDVKDGENSLVDEEKAHHQKELKKETKRIETEIDHVKDNE